jgi:mannose/cellobiose epimerase-like protein (N-acyl-D-glucosamine 2-epimerase family)
MAPFGSSRLSTVAAAVAVAGALLLAPGSGAAAGQSDELDGLAVPPVLAGDTWLRHHAEELMPYWDLPEALGVPVGNFPSFRGADGELLPESPLRGVSTLARQVYGYSLAFMLTGEPRYLTYAKAGLDWIDSRAADPVHGGFYGRLTEDGAPVNAQAAKDVFTLASLGLAYGMYFNATRDPDAEAGLLAVRDLIFSRYYVPARNRVRDAMRFDFSREVGPGDNGGEITSLLVPGTAVLLPFAAILSDPVRRAQFTTDLGNVTNSLIAQHKNTDPQNSWWFWGLSGRFGRFDVAQTDFGHNLKSAAMITNADKRFPARPWQALSADRDTLLARAWDPAAGRWNDRQEVDFDPANAVPDSAWWVHNEADQLLAALDFSSGFAHHEQLAVSAQTWLDDFVDRDSPAGEVFARPTRDGVAEDLRKSFFGKNMLHAHEHALIMYLHGRAMEDRPARLHYAFPADQALTAVAKPYWFDALAETRTVGRSLRTLPGHHVVKVDFSGIDLVPAAPYPTPDDVTPPQTVATVTSAGGGAVDVSFTADDAGVGVKEIHVVVDEGTARDRDSAVIDPGEELTLRRLRVPGEYRITYFAVDTLGNTEASRTLDVSVG